MLIFGVVNGEPAEGRAPFIAKAFAALSPGGRIVLRDFVLDPDPRVRPKQRSLHYKCCWRQMLADSTRAMSGRAG